MDIRQIITVCIAVFLYVSPIYGQSIKFTDITVKSGISFKYNFGDYTYENILESSGSGVTIIDYNNDGFMDIYLLQGTFVEGISDEAGRVFANSQNALYHNNGDGTFTDVTKKAGLNDLHWSMAAGAFDYDGDGDADLYELNYGPNVFYRNNGNGTFTDITSNLGLKGPDKLNGFEKWSVGVAYWDIDLDGRTDMMVGNFLAFDPSYKSSGSPDMMPHPSEYKGQASLFYRQKPDGSFEEITKSLGFLYPESMCMGLTVFDYDQDGDLDLFQGNDHQANFMFRNDGKMKFTEVAIQIGVAVNDLGKVTGSMHGSVGDIDGDGLIDLLVSDLEHGALYRNLGNGLFEDITRKSGIADQFVGKGQWATQLFDYDNDGDLDIFSANGNGEALILQLPLLLENDGYGYFTNVGSQVSHYFTEKRSGRGAAVVDYDNDGDLDLMISHVDLKATPALLRNEGNGNNWIGISLKGKSGPASAVGALVTVITSEKKQVLINQPANAYLSWNDPRIHVGLGKANTIDSIEITWQGGIKEVIKNVPVNQYIRIEEGNGIVE